MAQELGEELAKLQADARDQDAHKRQLKECIAYHRSLREEKDLRAKIDEVWPMLLHGLQLLQNHAIGHLEERELF